MIFPKAKASPMSGFRAEGISPFPSGGPPLTGQSQGDESGTNGTDWPVERLVDWSNPVPEHSKIVQKWDIGGGGAAIGQSTCQEMTCASILPSWRSSSEDRESGPF